MKIDESSSEKPNNCEDTISREPVLTYIKRIQTTGLGKKKSFEFIKKYVEKQPSVTPKQKMGRCKDCKHFEYDSVAKVDGIPLIVAHEICIKWGDGCKTREDGYCFLFEQQERSDKE